MFKLAKPGQNLRSDLSTENGPDAGRRSILGAGGIVAGALGAMALTHSEKAHATTTNPFVNVLDFGAVGNGIHDDTAAIQAALNAAANNCACYLPNTGSSYVISSSINVPSNSNVILFGSVLLAAHANQLMLSLGSNVRITGSGTLDGNRLNQNPTPTQGLAGIYAYGSTNIHISDITVTNCYHWPVSIVNSSYVRLENCTFSNSGDSAEFAGTSSHCWAVGCTIFATPDEAFAFYNGVTDSGITQCTLYGSTGGAGISVLNDSGSPGCQRLSICNNHAFGNWLSGIAVDTGAGSTSAHQDINICGNILYGNCLISSAAYHTLYLSNVKGVVVSNNQIFRNGHAVANYGIFVNSNVARATISSNDIHDEGQSTGGTGVGIYVLNGASRIVIIGNNIYDSQATKTMAFALAGTATSGVTAMSNVLGPTIGAPLQLPAGTNYFVNNQIIP